MVATYYDIKSAALQQQIDINLPKAAAKYGIKLDGMVLKHHNQQNRKGRYSKDVTTSIDRNRCLGSSLINIVAVMFSMQ